MPKTDEDIIIEREELMGIYIGDENMSEDKAVNFVRKEMLNRMERAGDSRQEAVYRFHKLKKVKSVEESMNSIDMPIKTYSKQEG